MSDPILENAYIERLVQGLPRSPLQLNRLQEADAELIRLPGTNAVLALKTDSIVEEIETGLYADPYLLGWMTVTVNASDLAAVGAEPIGLLLNETLPPAPDERYLKELQRGISDACTEYGLPVLGGDTNFSPHVQLGGFALGLVPDGHPVTRVGCHAGDLLYASGPLGGGAAYALAVLGPAMSGAERPQYRPRARIREGVVLRPFASCCMDSSDGVLPTLDQLARLNGVGFRIDSRLEDVLDRSAQRVAAGFAPWMLLAGPHGEFELLFTVPPDRQAAFDAAAAAVAWNPLRLGVVTPETTICLPYEGVSVPVDTARVRNLFAAVGGDVRAYVQGLLEIDASMRQAIGRERREEPVLIAGEENAAAAHAMSSPRLGQGAAVAQLRRWPTASSDL
jgi:thiamine-monophosphate kinase